MPPPAAAAREGEEDNGDIPPAFTEDLTVREMKASFKSNKGALTRLFNQVKVRAVVPRVVPAPPAYTAQLLTLHQHRANNQ